MTDMKSCYPGSLCFDQINVILNLVKERMDVDVASRKEKKKEAFFSFKAMTEEQ
jgi:hypothetical protein